MVREMQKRMLIDKDFKKALSALLINDYFNGDLDLSLSRVKEKTEALLETMTRVEFLDYHNSNDELIEN